MIRTLATVVAVESGTAIVSCQQESTCGHCSSQESCGTGIVSKAMPGRAHNVKIATTSPLTVGQLVEIGLSERSMLTSSFLVYMLPLVFLIVGTLLGQWLFIDLGHSNQFGVIATGLLSMALGLLIVRNYTKRFESDSAYKPSLIRVLGSPILAGNVINPASKDSE